MAVVVNLDEQRTDLQQNAQVHLLRSSMQSYHKEKLFGFCHLQSYTPSSLCDQCVLGLLNVVL